MENAGYLERFVAAMIDSVISTIFSSVIVIIMIVLSIFLMVPLFGYETPVYTQSNLLPVNDTGVEPMVFLLFIIALMLGIILIILFNFFLFAYRPYKNNGQTYGKQLMNIKVVRVDGKELTLGLLTMRYLVSAVINSAISFLTYITIFFDQDRRAIYDIVVGTKVVTTA